MSTDARDEVSDQVDRWHMARAIEIAALGQGSVEPNPMVGCVIARGAEAIAEGWHARFGGPHAEVEALAMAGSRASGATLYVSLEPCCHTGKTPPCTRAILAAGVARVVAAMRDPFPRVAGGGIEELRRAGVRVDVGPLKAESRRLNAPYLKLVETGRPWVIAKWAMTLDGKLATRARGSRWISCESSRAIAHRLRGRMDAVIVGIGTALADDPLLTARPRGPRMAARIVLDRRARLPIESQLVKTAREAPLLIVTGGEADAGARHRLEAAGCETLPIDGQSPAERVARLLDELGRRRMTNVLVEGGSQVLGAFFDASAVDEAHVFVAPKIAGGAEAPSPVGGLGIESMARALRLAEVTTDLSGDDVYVRGRVTTPKIDNP